ncbi:MAG: ribosome small subunit-dependent GTPase A [Eggerthellaceae bacterium]|nr:ribosome small subunit-dependent GTPase A [Eggerthellaceae bacterium]
MSENSVRGTVVKLDRSLPLVELEGGERVRCEHATELVKGANTRAVIGDEVLVSQPDAHDVCVIRELLPRRTQLVRRDPRERTAEQVMAANFGLVFVVQPLDRLNLRRMERELVLAFETGADVAVLLTKADLLPEEEVANGVRAVEALVGNGVPVVVLSRGDDACVDRVREMVPPGLTAVLMGQSGAGKSTLINRLTGEDLRKTSSVREGDGKGRHTTVSRETIQLPGGGKIVDMPGVRGMGLWDAEAGIAAAFADVEVLASECKFRDCAHGAEPGCAVQAAIARGELSEERLASYLGLRAELADTQEKLRQQGWRN